MLLFVFEEGLMSAFYIILCIGTDFVKLFVITFGYNIYLEAIVKYAFHITH